MTMLRRIDDAAREVTNSIPVSPSASQIRSWGRGLFRSGEEPCPAVIDIHGTAPGIWCSVHTHTIEVGGGRWRLTARFDLCADAGQYPWILQFVAGPHLTGERVPPSGDGVYEVSLEQEWEGARIVELQLYVASPAFHGELRFLGATVERIGELPINR